MSLNKLEALEAILKGKKVGYQTRDIDDFFYIKDNKLCNDENEDECVDIFDSDCMNCSYYVRGEVEYDTKCKFAFDKLLQYGIGKVYLKGRSYMPLTVKNNKLVDCDGDPRRISDFLDGQEDFDKPAAYVEEE